MTKLTLEFLLENLTHAEDYEKIFKHYGISFHEEVMTKGTDTYSVVQRNKFIKTITGQEYQDIIIKCLNLEKHIMRWSDTNEIQIRYPNKSMNVIYQIIQDLGCRGPKLHPIHTNEKS